jgi:hypothetical protein
LVIGAWSVPADQASAYSAVVGKLRENLLSIRAHERFGTIRPPVGGGPGIGRIAMMVAVAVWIVMMLVLKTVNTSPPSPPSGFPGQPGFSINGRSDQPAGAPRPLPGSPAYPSGCKDFWSARGCQMPMGRVP